jgi:hypothetical protein
VDAGGPADAAGALLRKLSLDLEPGPAANGAERPDMDIEIDQLSEQPKAVGDLPFDCHLASLRGRVACTGEEKQRPHTQAADNATSHV